MRRMTASSARENFSDTINRVVYGGERVVLRRRGKDLAAVIPIADFALLERMEDQLDLEAARKAMGETKRLIPYERVRRKLRLGK